MEQKVEFILAWRKWELSLAALCRSFGISRQTGYKGVSRFTAMSPVAQQQRARHPKGWSEGEKARSALTAIELPTRNPEGPLKGFYMR